MAQKANWMATTMLLDPRRRAIVAVVPVKAAIASSPSNSAIRAAVTVEVCHGESAAQGLLTDTGVTGGCLLHLRRSAASSADQDPAHD
jgi:hypothetical protein